MKVNNICTQLDIKFLFHILKIGLTMENFSHDGNIPEAKG